MQKQTLIIHCKIASVDYVRIDKKQLVTKLANEANWL